MGLRVRPRASLAPQTILNTRFCEALQVRLRRSLNAISALVKRQSLQTADHLVRDPKGDAASNTRS
jgi:hypothetical protein